MSPPGHCTPDRAVLVLSDIFGLSRNSKILADKFAGEGYLTVLPDLFCGDAVPQEKMNADSFDIHRWIANHTPDYVDPIVDCLIHYLRETHQIKRVYAAGYCFGAKVGYFERGGEQVHLLTSI